jgi:hypothetical protein
VDRLKALQTRTLNRLMTGSRVKRVIENETLNGSEAYTTLEMFEDLRTGIFSELSTGEAIDTYRRNLQKALVEKMGELYNIEDEDIRTTDIPSLARGNLLLLQSEIGRGLARQNDAMSQIHLQSLDDRIEQILDAD